MPRAIVVNESIVIPGKELQVTHARSAGPGGQNVNKVNTKAVLRWRVVDSPSLPDDVRRRFLQKFANRINIAGEVVLAADEHRVQSRNLAACIERLRQMVAAAATTPRRRVKTRPTRAAVERRIQDKRQASQKKGSRRFRAEPGE